MPRRVGRERDSHEISPQLPILRPPLGGTRSSFSYKIFCKKVQKKKAFGALKNSGEFFPMEPANPLSEVVSLL